MFRDKSMVSKIVRRRLFDHLTYLCELFDEDVAQHPKVFDLLSELLMTPSLASEFCKSEDSPIRSLFNSAMETFPLEFVPLTMIAQSLAASGSSKYVSFP